MKSSPVLFLPVLFLIVLASSCTKSDTPTCTARNSDGEAMYEVVGSDVCEDQISTENGEYCDCMN